MEDIDKDGDGKINLDEYIGKLIDLDAWNHPLWLTSTTCTVYMYVLLLYRRHVHTREWGEWAWLGSDREETFLRVQRYQQGKRTKRFVWLTKQYICIRSYAMCSNYVDVFCI